MNTNHMYPGMHIPSSQNDYSTLSSVPDWLTLNLNFKQPRSNQGTPSTSPSPCPSLSSSRSNSSQSAHQVSMPEIEEITDDNEPHEYIHGEFEEPPEQPDPGIYDQDEVEIVDGFEVLNHGRSPSPVFSWAHTISAQMLSGGKKKKRSLADSEEDYDNLSDSSCGSWRSARRRKVGKGKIVEVTSTRSSPEFMMEMEI